MIPGLVLAKFIYNETLFLTAYELLCMMYIIELNFRKVFNGKRLITEDFKVHSKFVYIESVYNEVSISLHRGEIEIKDKYKDSDIYSYLVNKEARYIVDNIGYYHYIPIYNLIDMFTSIRENGSIHRSICNSYSFDNLFLTDEDIKEDAERFGLNIWELLYDIDGNYRYNI